MIEIDTPAELDAPIVSSLAEGETLDIVKMIPGKSEHSERIIFQNVVGYFIRTHINYFGHKERTIVFDLNIANQEANGHIHFEGWEINQQTDKFLVSL